MKIKMQALAALGFSVILAILEVGSASAEAEIGKTIVEKLTAKIAQLQGACGRDIKQYCKSVTPGQGRVIYCLQAHEDKIGPKCTYELGETASSVQSAADALKEAVIACKPEITGVCGKTVPGQGRIAACLMTNKSTASKDCVDAIQKVDALAEAK
ncbi:cysteine rich repeat-containing protein [Bradyrhizobium sp. SSUT112]|uniref:cysteine rich repeat-containing protein n=1 Tax=Bradyrhizobium sp. SSUT112 TaxID=3040604 RepID=UPI00244743B5|nr:cysteine rich repeat-containing protein [Bradyrhizobium sp. SSUT112]MDH2352768.1 cysteine rich repeat-containing protein [Bradyrhizobium sp. SSUT112]